MKRLLDLTASIIGLALLFPFFILLAAAIKLDTAGPVFFRQWRMGRHERPFQIHKFRTMTVADRAGLSEITVEGDSRITRTGHLLRQYRIDELPQLIDVFLGRMSLVGPRPEALSFIQYYTAEQRSQIFSVRPGITDSAAIEFRNEAKLLSGYADVHQAYVEHILPKKIDIHLEYVANATLSRDVALMMKTIEAVFLKRDI